MTEMTPRSLSRKIRSFELHRQSQRAMRERSSLAAFGTPREFGTNHRKSIGWGGSPSMTPKNILQARAEWAKLEKAPLV
jgi:hypothetical protein